MRVNDQKLLDIDLKDANHLDVVFCKRKTLLSRLIRKFTKSDWSHVALVLNYNGTVLIADSQINGTNIKELSVWQKKYKYETRIARYSYKILPSKQHDIEDRVHSVIGVTGYDFASLLIKQPIFLITKKWFGKRRNPAKKRLYCSEFIAYAFNIGKWWKMTPEDLWSYMKKSNHWSI